MSTPSKSLINNLTWYKTQTSDHSAYSSPCLEGHGLATIFPAWDFTFCESCLGLWVIPDTQPEQHAVYHQRQMLLSFHLYSFTLNLHFHAKGVWLYGTLKRCCCPGTRGAKHWAAQRTWQGNWKRSLRRWQNWGGMCAASLFSKPRICIENEIFNRCIFMVYWKGIKKVFKKIQ